MDFRDDIALLPLDTPGAYQADITERWWIVTGPNGGLLAALLLRAVQAHLGESRPELSARILTVQFLAGPRAGPVRLDVAVEREGRRVAFTTVTMTQDDRSTPKVICQAKVTLIADLGAVFDVADQIMPAAPPAQDCPLFDPSGSYGNARRRWQRRPVPVQRAGEVAAWMRLDPPVPLDAAVLALMCDNLPPSLRSHEPDPAVAERIHTTTIEMTVYFRRATVGLAPEDECLVVLRSASVIDGLHQEEGEVWSPDGRLLATSRQMALVFLRS